ncbi:MAG: hypothetical protein PHI35_00420, partial [Victivallaceae bacterium]|nr:hypothetical protein [Victivallaceae bacterium]
AAAKFIGDLAPGLLGVWAPFAATLAVALTVAIVLRQSLKYMKSSECKLALPPIAGKLGSFACAFIAGFTLAAFVVFLVMLTPLRDRVPTPDEAFDKSCIRLLAVSARVNALSMQEFYSPDYRDQLDGMRRESAPPPPKELKSKSAATAASDSKTVEVQK